MKSFEIVASKYICLLEDRGVIAEQDSNGTIEYSHLLWMLQVIISDQSLSETKRNRWLGFIQGVLVCKGDIEIKSERDSTREIFKGE
ncbi:hypothetical protein [Robertmurraya sp.]|uniref:hypothetical protein n=1 Tax=Robertmurraya sp. TaxID=2837525 RepID=UPI00370449BA